MRSNHTFALCLFITLHLGMASSATYAAELNLGTTAPEVHGQLLDGKPFTSAGLLHQVVIVHFWATWCDQCRKEMPALDSYYRRHRDNGLRVIAVSMDDQSDLSAVKKVMANYAFDGAMASAGNYSAYGRIWRIPLTLVIDRQGILRADSWNEEEEVNLSTLNNRVSPLLGQP